jgi:hypothetical protein
LNRVWRGLVRWLRCLSELMRRLRILLRLAWRILIALVRMWLGQSLVLLLNRSILGCRSRLGRRSGMRDILCESNSRVVGDCRPRCVENWRFHGNDDSRLLLRCHLGVLRRSC